LLTRIPAHPKITMSVHTPTAKDSIIHFIWRLPGHWIVTL
jgi:hypothetical protein